MTDPMDHTEPDLGTQARPLVIMSNAGNFVYFAVIGLLICMWLSLIAYRMGRIAVSLDDIAQSLASDPTHSGD